MLGLDEDLLTGFLAPRLQEGAPAICPIRIALTCTTPVAESLLAQATFVIDMDAAARAKEAAIAEEAAAARVVEEAASVSAPEVPAPEIELPIQPEPERAQPELVPASVPEIVAPEIEPPQPPLAEPPVEEMPTPPLIAVLEPLEIVVEPIPDPITPEPVVVAEPEEPAPPIVVSSDADMFAIFARFPSLSSLETIPPEVLSFLKEAEAGELTLNSLDPSVLDWLRENQLASSFHIRFE